MTPKEKAVQLTYEISLKIPYYYFDKVKELAIMMVDEILYAVTTIADKKYEFYQQVKQEIEKL